MAGVTNRAVLDALAALGVVAVLDPEREPKEPDAPPMPAVLGMLASIADSAARMHKFSDADHEMHLMVGGYIQATTDDPDASGSVEAVLNNVKVRAALIANVLGHITGAQIAHAQQHASMLLVRLLCLADADPRVRAMSLDGITDDLQYLNQFAVTARASLNGESCTTEPPPVSRPSRTRRTPRRP